MHIEDIHLVYIHYNIYIYIILYIYVRMHTYICVYIYISACPGPKKQIQLRSPFHGRKIHQEYIIYTL